MATLKLIQECVIPAPSRVNPKIPAELERILVKGLVKDVTLRYQGAGIFHKHLQEFLSRHYPSFTQKEVADVLQSVFDTEIEKEKKRFEEIYRQSIPFSQGAHVEKESSVSEDLEGLLEGEITKEEQLEGTPVTSVDLSQEDDKADSAGKEDSLQQSRRVSQPS